MAKIPPYTRMTLEHLRECGYEPAVVEKWIPQTQRRLDLFNVIDVVCLHPEMQGVLGVQSTSFANVSSRSAKIRDEPRARLWLETGNTLLLFGWEKYRPRRQDGTPAKIERFRPRVFRFTVDNFDGRGRPDEIEFGRKR